MDLLPFFQISSCPLSGMQQTNPSESAPFWDRVCLSASRVRRTYKNREIVVGGYLRSGIVGTHQPARIPLRRRGHPLLVLYRTESPLSARFNEGR